MATYDVYYGDARFDEDVVFANSVSKDDIVYDSHSEMHRVLAVSHRPDGRSVVHTEKYNI